MEGRAGNSSDFCSLPPPLREPSSEWTTMAGELEIGLGVWMVGGAGSRCLERCLWKLAQTPPRVHRAGKCLRQA